MGGTEVLLATTPSTSGTNGGGTELGSSEADACMTAEVGCQEEFELAGLI